MTPTQKRFIAGIVALVAIAAIATILFFGFHQDGQTTSSQTPRTPPGPMRSNRKIPAFKPFRSGFHLSPRPTKEELLAARPFEEPLIPIGGEPTLDENAELATALDGYAKRKTIDDFSSLTRFLANFPGSPWTAALLTNLGTEYYNTAHYSLAVQAWSRAWMLTKGATEPLGRAIAERAGAELAYLSAKLGRMTELEAFFDSIGDRVFHGPASERVADARAGLSQMIERPEVSFRCGPLALSRILLATAPDAQGTEKALDRIHAFVSTPAGVSLSALRRLSRDADMNYQMAFRESGDFIVPSVIHWKVDHYAAIIRKEGENFLLQDPTFATDVWATRDALQSEASGYFLIPGEVLPAGWRSVAAEEGDEVLGKGYVENDCGDECLDHCEPRSSGDSCHPDPNCGGPPQGGSPGGGPGAGGGWQGMTVAQVHLNTVNLHLQDHPLQYYPPLGPPIRFSVYYNHRDSAQPAVFTYSHMGPKWTNYWTSYILDNPRAPLSDVRHYVMGGGIDRFTGYDPATRSFAAQTFKQTKLIRTSGDAYRLVQPDGSTLMFAQPDWAIGTQRKVFLTQVVDPSGNALTFSYDEHLRLVGITDGVGQVTLLSYEDTNDQFRITKVADPFGRFASFDYDTQGRLVRITDIGGIESEFTYDGTSEFITSLTTPYGSTSFTRQEGTTRWIESSFPDGNAERVEFKPQVTFIASSEPQALVPKGMATKNEALQYRNTFYWNKLAMAKGRGDYTKATLYHWLHSPDFTTAAGIAESTKKPLESRVWYDYAGQGSAWYTGNSNKPSHIGRVLDDGTTQLYTYEYNEFGHVTKSIDPVGRTFRYIYADNGADLLEVRQIRQRNDELLSRISYDDSHHPLEITDAAGQTSRFSYNNRGQLLTTTDPRGGVVTRHYDNDGYLTSIDGPLPGTSDTTSRTYDAFGRVRTTTDVSGYTRTFDYDTFDRLTKTTYPDGTFDQRTFTLLDLTQFRDRAGRITSFEYNAARQRTKTIDPLNRDLRFDWCACGSIALLTDAMGRSTKWAHDIQGRPTQKTYPDGTAITFNYESRTSRLRERIDPKGQKALYEYNNDDTQRRISYSGALVETSPVSFSYDPDYSRPVVMTDGIGTTVYSYNPIAGIPQLGAGSLARVDGPLPNQFITYDYDELGAVKSYSVAGDVRSVERDLAGRITTETNALGEFTYTYDGDSYRRALETFPNGQTVEYEYGTVQQDFDLRRITNSVNGTMRSEFVYDRDVAAERITSWTQTFGVPSPSSSTYTFGYDDVNQLTSATLSTSGQPDQVTTYSYDLAGNRLTDLTDGTGPTFSYNALNQLTAISGSPTPPEMTYQWDAEDRLVEATTGTTTVKFGYDGLSRLASMVMLESGSVASEMKYIWNGDQIVAIARNDQVTKKFFDQGIVIVTELPPTAYYYSRDHLGSIRELIDSSGSTRARYSYSPFGTRTKTLGDADADFGFTGLLTQYSNSMVAAQFRTYDASIGRWLSRDPLGEFAGLDHGSALMETPFLQAWRRQANLLAYVNNDPINYIDPDGRLPWFVAAPVCWYYQWRAADEYEDCSTEYKRACSDPLGQSCEDFCGGQPTYPTDDVWKCVARKNGSPFRGMLKWCTHFSVGWGNAGTGGIPSGS